MRMQYDLNTSVSEVTVSHAGQLMAVHECLERSQIISQVLGRDGGVLPSGPGWRTGRGLAGQACTISADLPETSRRGASRVHHRIDGRGTRNESIGIA